MKKAYESPKMTPVETEVKISNSKKIKMGCWGPSPEDNFNQC